MTEQIVEGKKGQNEQSPILGAQKDHLKFTLVNLYILPVTLQMI